MRVTNLLAGTAMATVLAGCAVLTPLPEPVSVDQRLAAIPVSGVPIDAPVRIHWNEFQVPFIEAESDTDLAVALGVVHAHLRWGQMEVARSRSKTDRRSHELHVTDGGTEMLERITPMVRDHDAAITANLTETESRELLRLLRKVTGV